MDILPQNAESIYEALELLLRGIFPEVPVYQANMPFSKMDEMTRSCAKAVTYLVQKDTPKRNNDGLSGARDLEIEVNLFGELAEIDRMAGALTTGLAQGVQESAGWLFALVVSDKKDVWEPNIKTKRIWVKFAGIAFC